MKNRNWLVSYTNGSVEDPRHCETWVKAPNIRLALESVIEDGLDVDSIDSIEDAID